MNKQIKFQKQAFTLVELIVVVTILAILSTIGFVSYSGYLTGVRDTNRLASLTAISDGLELYRTKNDLPTPDDSVEVKVNGTTIARQGYVGKNVLQTIEYSKAGKDPQDDSYYSYYLTDDNKYYQLMAFLEQSEHLDTRNSLELGNQAYAATDYSKRHPKVYGKRLGILTDTNNTPIQELLAITSSGYLDIIHGLLETYNAYLSDTENLSGGGITLRKLGEVAKAGGKGYSVDSQGELVFADVANRDKSCLMLLHFDKSLQNQNGNYIINPTGKQEITVYCDMTTDGGGYTFYPVNSGLRTLKYTDNNTCKEMGMEIVVPRTKAHLGFMFNEFGPSYFQVIPGIYNSVGGKNYTMYIMNSDSVPDWKSVDGGKWWLRDTVYSEPNGDYVAGCRLDARTPFTIDNITFNDARDSLTECRYSADRYICSTNDKQ